MHRAITPTATAGHAVGVLQPDKDLSTESANRHRRSFGTEAPAGYVNPIVGRRKACINPEHGKHAIQLEEMGRSPRPICDVCPKRVDCTFYTQKWNPTGANYLQHAHAVVPPKGPMKLAVFDEDPTDILLSDDDKVRSIAEIGGLRGYAPVRSRGKRGDGGPLIGASNDIATYRSMLCELLRHVKGPLPVDLVKQFFDAVTVRIQRRVGKRRSEVFEHTTTKI